VAATRNRYLNPPSIFSNFDRIGAWLALFAHMRRPNPSVQSRISGGSIRILSWPDSGELPEVSMFWHILGGSPGGGLAGSMQRRDVTLKVREFSGMSYDPARSHED
jgi:hypothetical protein